MNLDICELQEHPYVSMLFRDVQQKFNLTRREGQVLELLMLNGSTNRVLSDELNLSEKTVKNHVASIQRKLNVNSSRELQAVIFRDALLPAFMFSAAQKKPIEGSRSYVALSS
ncbi:helix-turn-helix transcriptional regulator (plasmid) [Paenibacillus rhizovicinus]|uniref:Helix-turn-helix transcriptional regulator n=1 Tax=Paenibacillus rhizovicinus TaxID=2704463 RepID=A0A6C0PAL4_9BACL|nr:helix-turn-helix transcriptional regulator [Paenibacillus rhizovicinus]QHW35568.1 helix-turn-helix transcriptional regulator [Paenibacillus rhizovicinus]